MIKKPRLSPVFVAVSLFLTCGPAPIAAQVHNTLLGAANQEIVAFHAQEFYADSPLNEDPDNPIRTNVKSPEIAFSFHSGPNGALLANLDVMGDKPQRLSDLPARTSRQTAETAGSEIFKRALNLLAVMTGNDGIRTASSYTTYQVLRRNGEVYVMGINFFDGEKQVGSAVYYVTGVVGVSMPAPRT